MGQGSGVWGQGNDVWTGGAMCGLEERHSRSGKRFDGLATFPRLYIPHYWFTVERFASNTKPFQNGNSEIMLIQ